MRFLSWLIIFFSNRMMYMFFIYGYIDFLGKMACPPILESHMHVSSLSSPLTINGRLWSLLGTIHVVQ